MNKNDENKLLDFDNETITICGGGKAGGRGLMVHQKWWRVFGTLMAAEVHKRCTVKQLILSQQCNLNNKKCWGLGYIKL